MTETTPSADGTAIAWERTGSGPTLVIVTGTLNTARSMAPLARVLSPDFTVITYDRRGRGASGNTQPWAKEREIEDLVAVIEAAGGADFIYGHSAGGALTLDSVAAGAQATKVAVYEPPYYADPAAPQTNEERLAAVQAALDENDAAKAVETYFSESMNADQIDYMKHTPFWPNLLAVAHTIPYDMRIAGDGLVPERLAALTLPVLVIDGSRTGEWAARSAANVAAVLPDSTRETIEGQDHNPSPLLLAPLLVEFFGAAR